MDSEQTYPAENQWDLLVEHGDWLASAFHCLWVESDDHEELARLLKVDPASHMECDLRTLMARWDTIPQGVWMGPHAPGWTHLFVFGMYSFHPALRNLGKRRVFEMYNAGEVGEGLEPLYLNYDGERLGDVTPPYEEGGDMDLPDYRPCAAGLELGRRSGIAREAHLMFCVAGRITGRFADREWWTSPRSYYQIPIRS